MQNRTYRHGVWNCFGSSTVRRRLASLLGAVAFIGGVCVVKSAAADPVVGSALPSGDFMMNATFCPGSVSFSECREG
ncbi:MAG TPA: hypothetical protein VIV60_08635, partial [Polyangiaceae bacterium]